MKKILLVFLTLSFSSTISAQPFTQWAKDIGTVDNEYATGICSDNDGNSYVAGSYSESLIICNETLKNVQQPSGGNQTQNLFISKFDATGNCIWTKTGISIIPTASGGAVGSEINAITFLNGNIYCAGVFTNKMIFDSDTLFNPACTNYCTSSFIINLDTSGTIIWSKCFQASTSYSSIYTLIPHKNGVFVSGTYQGTMLIDTVQLNALNSWTYNGYLLNLNTSGNCLWAKNTGSSYIGSSALDMAFDNNKNLYITGNYGDSIVFPNITLHDSIPLWARSTFFAKYDTLGNFLWAKGGMTEIQGMITRQNLCFHPSGHIYFTGSFSDSVRFGNITFTTASTSLYKDVIVKLDSSGQFIWSKIAGNRNGSQNFGSIIQSNNSGFILFSGFIDTLIINNDTIASNSGSLDNILTQYDIDGNITWYKNFGGPSQEIPYDVHCNNDLIYLAGRTMSNYLLDAISIVNNGGGDILITLQKTNSTISNILPGNSIFPSAFSIYPNPASNSVSILNNTIIDQIIITDLIGQIVFESSPGENFIQYQFNKYGIYFVTITSDNLTTTRKVIVSE
jgi:hypothetical protein